MQKSEIAKQVRPITLEDAMADLELLRAKWKGASLNGLSNAGLRFLDHFTFEHRLAVRGKMKLNFFEFFRSWESFRERNYIKNLIRFYKNDESPKTIYKIYNLGICCVHAFRPVVALQIYDRFKPTHILDPCAGWGGRAMAASVFGAAYTGYDSNANLGSAYERMSQILNINLLIGDSLKIDFAKIKKYDMVMTSPPYYDLERYECAPHYPSNNEMDEHFYFPLFDALATHLNPNGWIVLSINQKLLDRVFSILFGPPHIVIPLPAYQRTNGYSESIYAWQKG